MRSRASVSTARGVVCLCGLLLCLGAIGAPPTERAAASRRAAEPAPAPGLPPALAPPVRGLSSTVLDPVNEKKIHVSSTDSKGDCPAGATKIERCSGVYPNGNSWEIAPCCRTVTE